MTKNIGESVRCRLKNIAFEEGSDFNAVLIRYGLERLLYRIGESEYSKQFFRTYEKLITTEGFCSSLIR